MSNENQVETDPLKIDSFTWSFQAGEASKQELKMQSEAYEERIDRIIHHERARIKGVYILEHILNFTSDPSDLKIIARACEKLADIVPDYEEAKRRYELVCESIENPTWIASVFGDFSSDVDVFTEELHSESDASSEEL